MVLHEGEWSVHASVDLPSVATEQRLRGALEFVWMQQKRKYLLPLPGIKPWFVSCLSHAMVQIRHYDAKLTKSSLLRSGTGFLKMVFGKIPGEVIPSKKNCKTVNFTTKRWWSL
jgi:hypothetical protein